MYIKKCRICRSNELELFLDLGNQPWCNDFITENQIGKEKVYPLQLCFCHNCTAVQINYTVPKEIMYSDHFYLSGTTATMVKHFQKISNKMCKCFAPNGLVIDIGSNDGTLLNCYKKNNMNILGIEPCKRSAKIALNNGIPTNIIFFNYEHATDIVKSEGKAKIITAANVFYHIEDLHDITCCIKLLLDNDGIFIVHFSYLPNIINRKEFDIMYHEHLLYYRLYTLNYLMNIYDMEIFDIDSAAEIHGGSIVAYICHKGKRKITNQVKKMYKQENKDGFNQIKKYNDFAYDVKILKSKIIELVHNLKHKGNVIYAFGAPAKGTVLLNYCGFSNKEITIAVEKNPFKFNHYIPCTNIPIVDEVKINEPDYYLLLAWNFMSEFCKSQAYIEGKRKFIIPLPKPHIKRSKNV